MNYYLLERDYKEEDIMIPFEYQGSLEIISEGKKSSLESIPYIGSNDTDYLTSGTHVVSENFKNFIEELKIQDVLFLPIQIEKDKKK